MWSTERHREYLVSPVGPDSGGKREGDGSEPHRCEAQKTNASVVVRMRSHQLQVEPR